MRKLRKSIICLSLCMALLLPICPAATFAADSNMDIIGEYINTVLQVGRYVDNSAYPHLFVDGINRYTKEPVLWYQDADTWMPSNLASQQLLMRVLSAYSDVTGDPKYKNIAKEQYQFYFDNLSDKNGLLYWGSHQWVDMISGGVVGEQPAHEFKGVWPYYEIMFETDFEATKKFIEAHWNAHVSDWSLLSFNRHGVYNREMSELWDSDYIKEAPHFEGAEHDLSFIHAGSDLVYSAMMLYNATGDERPHQWAKRVFQQYMDARDPNTHLGAYQFSTLNEEEGGDRAKLQFEPEFGDLAKEGKILLRTQATNIYGGASLAFMKAAEMTNDNDMLQQVLDGLIGFSEIVYDSETNTCEPMFTDGTSLLNYEVKISGYYGNKGEVFTTYTPNSRMALSYCVGTRLSQGNASIWDAARGMFKGFGMGDIGTAPGENIAINEDTTVSDPVLAVAAIELYKYTKNREYLKAAELICDNIIKYRYKDGLFSADTTTENVKLSSIDPYVIIAVEAAKQGKFDSVDYLCIGEGFIHGPYTGTGRTYDTSEIYPRKKTEVSAVTLSNNSMTVIAGGSTQNNAFADTTGHWAEENIKLMNSIGIVNGRGNGFEPDAPITRAEFLALVNRLCNFQRQSYGGGFYDVNTGDWYADDIQTAYTAGLIDINMTKDGGVHPNAALTREEMAAILVKAMMAATMGSYQPHGYISKFDDSQSVSYWARDYVDICTNTQIMNGVSETVFAPREQTTRAQACAVLERLYNMLDKPLTPKLEVTVLPENASDKRVTYESSDTGIVIVDDNGYLYGVSEGEAVVTARAGNQSAVCSVRVAPAEDWMVTSISLDGVPIESFDTFNFNYNIDLIKGTELPPEITATMANGSAAKITKTYSVPGTAKIGTGDKAYSINFTANAINYAVNDDFSSFEIGATIDNQTNKDWMFITNSYGRKGKSAEVAVVANPTDSKDHCVFLDKKDSAPQVEVRANFPQAITFGADADEDYIAYEVTFMQPKAGSDPKYFNGIYLYDGANKKNSSSFKIVQGTIVFQSEGKDIAIAPLEAGAFHTVKAVIDKRSKTADIYYDDASVVANVTLMNAATVNLADAVMVQVIDTDTTMYISDMKAYTIPKNAYEKPVIEETEESAGAAVSGNMENPFTDDFSTYEVGAELNGNGIWQSSNKAIVIGVPPRGGSKKVGISMPEIADSASGENIITSSSFGSIAIGQGTEEKNAVFEFDIMPGNDMYVNFLCGDSGSNPGIRLFFQGKRSIVHCSYTPEGISNDRVIYDNLSSKRVYTMKVVINKQKMTADIYCNDTMLLSEHPIYGNRYGNSNTLQRVRIETRADSSNEAFPTHSAAWFGNLKIYEEEISD